VIAVIPVRAGRAPLGAETAIDAAGGRALLIGEEVDAAAASLDTAVVELVTCEAGTYAPAAWAAGLRDALASELGVLLPGSPDGRDLLGRLGGVLQRRCVAWCIQVTERTLTTTRLDGRQAVVIAADEPYVATVLPRRASGRLGALPVARALELVGGDATDAVVLAVEDVDPAELELAAAPRIVAGGLGLGGEEEFSQLARVAGALRASVGATRPIADRGVVGHARQIGTTGVAVSPTLYVAFGISGAIQHTAALGSPERIVAVNTDPACPMMQLADLALVTDAKETLDELARLLGVP
jgi:electron transfer flavoprotein alpha subunit